MNKGYVGIFFGLIFIVFSVRHSFGVTEKKKETVQQTAKQPKITAIRKTVAQKWLRNSAKAVGVVALVGLAVYAFFQTSPVTESIIPTAAPLYVPNNSATGDREKYRELSHNFGKAGSILTLISMVNPALLPLAIALDLGAIYYGVKIVPKPDLYPIAWDQIMMVPEALPY